MNLAFVVPFRDRGLDPLRKANLDTIEAYLQSLNLGPVYICTDGRTGNAKFNRSAAYNAGARIADADTICYYESDVIVPKHQIIAGTEQAEAETGLVVPFTTYRYLSPEDSQQVRDGADPLQFTPEYTMDNGTSIGACNILTNESLQAMGQWPEEFEGNGYDDNAVVRALEVTCQPTRYIDGPLSHLFHQPAWYGLSRAQVPAEDRAATERNRRRYNRYLRARTPDDIRHLTTGGR